MSDIDKIRSEVSLPDIALSMGVTLDRNGQEFETCCPFHEERTPSFTVFPGRDGVWRYHCFGCGAKGDVIDFVKEIKGVETHEAIQILNGDRAAGANVQPKKIEARDPYKGITLLVPNNTLAPNRNVVLHNPKRERNGNIKPSAVFPYRHADGSLIGYVLRHDLPDGGKETPQVCWVRLPDGRECWSRFPFPKPRPLYGAERIRPETTQVIVVEGEKKVDAIFAATGRIAVSAAGGVYGGRYADWSALKGKKVLIWPDADPEGFKYMAELAEILSGIASELKFIDVLRECHEGNAVSDGGGVAGSKGAMVHTGGRGAPLVRERGSGGGPHGAGRRADARDRGRGREPGRAFGAAKGACLTYADWRAGTPVPKGWDAADAVRDQWNKAALDGFMLNCRVSAVPSWPDDPIEPPPEPDLNMPVDPVGADAIDLIPKPADIEHGSEVHIAQVMSLALEHYCGPVVHADGRFWAWGPTCWRAIPDKHLRLAAHKYDNVTVQGKNPIKVGRTMINGILSEVGTILSHPDFFNRPSVALNCADTVIEIAKGGAVTLRSHSPEDRFRFTIPARYGNGRDDVLPEGSYLHRLVMGAFRDDPDAAEKIDLIGEILGASAFGIATRLPQPKAFVFLGETASNGKSTIASLLECLLPEGAVSHIPPSAYEDERRIVNLAGKAANVADELSANAIAGETFKAAVTGNSIEGRDLYRSAVTFVPRAIHVFTTNTLPRFHGGLDRGLQRRLVVVRFNRPIPENEIIEDIADRIRHDELDLLLRFSIEGARRLFERRSYTVPASSQEALSSWLRLDPLVEWFEENIAPASVEPIGGWKRTSDLFKHFKAWAVEQGHAEKFLPPVNTFSQRLKVMPGVVLKKRSSGMLATGIVLSEGGIQMDKIEQEDIPW